MDFKVGDRIEVSSVKVDTEPRRGQVLKLGSGDPVELRVEWDDGHESTLFPSGGMVKVIGKARRKR